MIWSLPQCARGVWAQGNIGTRKVSNVRLLDRNRGARHPLRLDSHELSPTFRITSYSEVRMSNFMTLLVEDDAFQREALADVLKDEGFEVI